MRKAFILTSMLLLLFSCGTTKDIAYFQDAEHGKTVKIEHRPITLRPEDKISIVVNTRKQEISNILNLPYITRQIGHLQSNNGSQYGLSGYTLDSDGFINFPEIGKIHVAGLTRNQVAEKIRQQLIDANLVQDAVVTVEFMNLTYSILGEVKTPSRYNINKDAVTIIDAISQAGDLTIQGQRTNIKVLRQEEDGTQKTYCVNLCSLDELQQSPVYYLQQNDVIYVEPNDMRARQSTVNGNNFRSSAFWISIASLLTSITSIITR